MSNDARWSPSSMAREPEIGDLHFAPVTEQDVLRLDVAMNETR